MRPSLRRELGPQTSRLCTAIRRKKCLSGRCVRTIPRRRTVRVKWRDKRRVYLLPQSARGVHEVCHRVWYTGPELPSHDESWTADLLGFGEDADRYRTQGGKTFDRSGSPRVVLSSSPMRDYARSKRKSARPFPSLTTTVSFTPFRLPCRNLLPDSEGHAPIPWKHVWVTLRRSPGQPAQNLRRMSRLLLPGCWTTGWV